MILQIETGDQKKKKAAARRAAKAKKGDKPQKQAPKKTAPRRSVPRFEEAPPQEGTPVTRSGFVALIGRPNVGKSTLLNRLVGQKVAIVSSRPQTTRNRILGVLTKDGAQMVLLDTPGLHAPRTKLGDYMMRQADSAIRSVDLVVLLAEPKDKPNPAELEALKKCDCPVVLAINKVDLVPRETLLSVIAAYSEAFPFAALIPISARTGEGVDTLLADLVARLPEGPAYFPEDAFTDQTERQLVSEFIREKALRALDKEVPHGIAVEIEQFRQEEEDLIHIGAVVYCEKESHKGIIIGKGGEMLKSIASAARRDMERMLGCRVFLEIFVKVRQNWRDSDFFLKNIGYREE
ncbi:MAG: GTPase Era [Clostridia bacterium]|nr:GTPase Era [Clostridia bacterium]